MSDKQDVVMLIEKDLNEYRGRMYKATGRLELKAKITKQYAEGLYEFVKGEVANGDDARTEPALPIQSVSQLREQLRAYSDYLAREWNCPDIEDDVLDEYIDALNCG